MRGMRFLGIAVVLAALAGAVNALAFKYASVDNGLALTVATTSSSALAFDAPTALDPGISVSTAGGTSLKQLAVTINDHIQPGSTYKWVSAFKITNQGYWNGAGYTPYGSVTLGYDTAADNLGAGLTMRLTKSGTGAGLGVGTDINGFTLDNGVNQSVDVDLEIEVADTYVGAGGSVTITMTGTR